MNEATQVASTPMPLWGVFLIVLFVLALIGVGIWLGRMAIFRPEKFKSVIESPLDRAAQALANQGWTPAQVDEVLKGWANRDLTAKVAGAYEGLPPDVLEAAQKIADYAAKVKAPKG